MSCRAPYTPCKIFYDGARNLNVGDYLETRGGSAYLVQSIRANRNKSYRKHLGVLRMPAKEIPPGSTIHMLYWYVRKKKMGRKLTELKP